jgi:4-hydroxy-4-methyl-2-oxoglutarate aldolase
MFHVMKRAAGPPDDLLAAWSAMATATVHEVLGQKGAVDPLVRPLTRGLRLCGRALTVHCPPRDNLMLIKAVSLARAGDVIVVSTDGFTRAGLFGEVLAVECQTKKLAGLVTTGSVRDSEALIRLGFPVFSAGLSIGGTAKASLGTINHQISFGGVLVQPGDIVLGDDDGLVVTPQARAGEVLAAARLRDEKEAGVMEKLRSGGSLFDIYAYQATLARLGCLEED